MNPIKTLLSDAAFAAITTQERVLFISKEKKNKKEILQTKEMYGLIDRKSEYDQKKFFVFRKMGDDISRI